MRKLAAIIAACAFVTSAYGGNVYIRPLDTHEAFLYYSKRGETGWEVMKKFKAEKVYPGPYFNGQPMRKDGKGRINNGYRSERKPFIPVDYLFKEGELLGRYRSDLARPLVWFEGQQIEIVRKYSALEELLTPTCTAFAANNSLTYPSVSYNRPYLGVTRVQRGDKIVDALVLGCVKGTQNRATNSVALIKKQYGFSEHVWLDGGASYLMTEPRPFHLVVRKRTAK